MYKGKPKPINVIVDKNIIAFVYTLASKTARERHNKKEYLERTTNKRFSRKPIRTFSLSKKQFIIEYPLSK